MNIIPLSQTLPRRESPLLEVVRYLQSAEEKISPIVSDLGELMGTITDGDVRRGLLSGLSMESRAFEAMNDAPKTIQASELDKPLPALLKQVEYLVVLSESRIPVGLIRAGRGIPKNENSVVLMAGGRGTRLLPLTESTPKPLITVGDRPMIEILIERVAMQGFRKFFVSVGHLGEQIKDRLQSGADLGVEVEYLEEQVPRGTAGSLSMLKGLLEKPFLVANADLVTRCDFRSLLSFNQQDNAVATVGVREYLHTIPFGVAELAGERLVGLEEKPVLQRHTAAGIYCFQPRVLNFLRPDETIDMPDLIKRLLSSPNEIVTGFPVHEEWDDVGQLLDLERVRSEWNRN